MTNPTGRNDEVPEFPAATPVEKYIVDQVSKLDNAAFCSTGYFKMFKDVKDRLEKLDLILNDLKQSEIEITEKAKIIQDARAHWDSINRIVIEYCGSELNKMSKSYQQQYADINANIAREMNKTNDVLTALRESNIKISNDAISGMEKSRKDLKTYLSDNSSILKGIQTQYRLVVFALGVVVGGIGVAVIFSAMGWITV